MKTSPTGFQLTFLLFAIAFFAMLIARAIAPALGVPDPYFNTLGNLIGFPLDLAFILALPALRALAFEGLRQPIAPRARVEAVALSGVKLAVTFGVWGAVALWGLHVTQQSSNLNAFGFLLDRHPMDAHYFSAWGLATAVLAVTLGPFAEEVIYRGVLFRLWERQWGWVPGMFLSSAVFASIHPGNLLQTFLSGIIYVCVLRRTRSLWAPILCHAFYNLLVTWPLFGHLLMLKPPEAATSIAPWIPNLICLGLGSIAAVLYIVLATRKPAPN
jgi:uncharacterized protein